MSAGPTTASKGYSSRLFSAWTGKHLTMVEKLLLATMIAMLAISAFDALSGYGVGGGEKLRLVKLRAQQELTAQRPQH